MRPSLMARLRRMDRREIAFRARTFGRVHAQRVEARIRQPRWERRSIATCVSNAVVDDDLRARIADEDWTAVQERLERAIAGRPSRFVLDPAHAPSLRQAIVERWPDAPAAAAAAGDRLIEGTYDLLGYRSLRFQNGRESEVDWHFDPVHHRHMPRRFWADVNYLDPAAGDHKLTWELNRHQHWLALGRAAWLCGRRVYADRIVRELASWLPANPPRTGGNWASMLELAFRCESWVWAMHILLGEHPRRDRGPWLVDMLVAIDAQLTHVEQNLSYYFSPNTHLTGEALALYVVGAALPELTRSSRWIDAGRAVLLEEIGKQIGADGGHAERSTHYHRYTLDFYLLALLTAEKIGDAEAVAAFSAAVDRLADFMKAMADDSGWVQQVGDDDGGMLWPIAGRDPRDVRDSLALAAVVLARPELAQWGLTEEALWIAGPARVERAMPPGQPAEATTASPAITAHVLRDTGYVVIRDGRGDHLVLDAGPHGYLNGGHAHADALAITLSVGGRPLLIDPGTATYTMDPALRDHMRGAAAHNTLMLDGAASSRPSGPFHWLTSADARLDGAAANPRFAWAEASHAGFAPVRHRRAIVRGAWGGWLVIDDVVGQERHTIDRHWHFDPGWQVASSGAGRMRAVHADGSIAWLLHDDDDAVLVRGDHVPGIGWCSPRYGELITAWTARTTRQARAPFAAMAWVGDGGSDAPALERLPVHGVDALAVRVTRGSEVVTTLRLAASGSEGALIGDYRTDARVLQYGTSTGGDVMLAVVGATRAVAEHDALLSLTAAVRVADLYVECRGERLEVWSSQVVPQIEIRGAALREVRTVIVNGRELSPDLARDGDRLTLAATESPAERRAFDAAEKYNPSNPVIAAMA